MSVATVVARNLPGWGGETALYRLDTPMADGDGMATFYVVASGVYAYGTGAPETLIFASDADGNVTDYLDLHGSFRGAIDPDAALERAGYRVEEAGR